LKTFIRSGAARRDVSLAVAFTIGMLALSSVRAHATVMDPITVTAPKVKIVKVIGRDSALNVPIEEVTATAIVKFNPVTLTTNSGIALLKDGVWSAAFQACEAAAPFSLGDGCVSGAVRSAQPQVDAAIARARSKR
jgi:UrcA family protein